jgi:predicted permease
MGATFDFDQAKGELKPSLFCTFMKLIGFCTIFLPIAALLGFRNQALVAILIMCGSSTTVSGFVMAKSMGHKGVLTSSVVMLTTLLSAFSITFWLTILKSFGLI